ncbi:unnamed protein product [Malus baccata var. baccata]
MEGHCDDDPMEEEVVEAMPRRIKGRGGLRAPSKTLDLDHPNNPPSFPRCNASQSPAYAPQRCQFLSLWRPNQDLYVLRILIVFVSTFLMVINKRRGSVFFWHSEDMFVLFFHLVNRLDLFLGDFGVIMCAAIEGWIILITGIHEEVQEDDLFNVFGNYGAIKDLHLNLDRRTGFVKGYVLIEYEKFEEAKAAISGMNGAKLFGQTISGDWAFSTGSFGGNLRSPELNRSRNVEVNGKLEFISTSWMYLRFKKPPTVHVFSSWYTNK